MKKLRLIIASLLCGMALSLNAQQVINIQASFYSEALDEVRNVRIYLPHDYYAYPGHKNKVIFLNSILNPKH